MGKNRFVTPDTVQIDIGDGDWIEVKKRLTQGELRKSQVSAIKTVQGSGPDARFTPDAEMLGKAEAVAYLVSWSLKDAEGRPVKIDTDERKKSALDNLDPDDFRIISDAIAKHADAMEAERAEAKKNHGGENKSSAISPSPSDSAGATSGSAS